MRKSITPLILSALALASMPQPMIPTQHASDTAINRLSQKGRRKRARWTGDGRKK